MKTFHGCYYPERYSNNPLHRVSSFSWTEKSKLLPKPKTFSSVDWKSVLISISPPLLLIYCAWLYNSRYCISNRIGGPGLRWCLTSITSLGEFSFNSLRESAAYTVKLTSMVFIILVGATAFSLVFKGLGEILLFVTVFYH